MGHCVESGYGLVDENGRPLLLEPGATPAVEAAIRNSGREHGTRLRIVREMRDGEMRTTDVTEVRDA